MKLETFYLHAWNEKEQKIVGVLPLVFSKSLVFGCFLTSIPYYNYAGILANTKQVAQQLLAEAIVVAQNKKAKHIELRHISPILDCMPRKNDKVRMVLDLPNNPQVLWKSFKSKLRSQIKRPLKEKIKVVFGQQELLDDFYYIFATNMRDLGTPVWPQNLFYEILKHFPQYSQMCVVYDASIAVAGAILLGFKDTLEIPSASSLRNHNHKSPNMLLYWKAMEYASLQGYQKFDFGRCSYDSGPYRFKKQWGAKEELLSWEYWLANKQLPKLNPQNPKYQIAIYVWQKLPLTIANFIGPIISRNLP